MRSPRQLSYQLKYGRRIYRFNNIVVDNRLFYGVEHEVCELAALLYVVQRFIDNYFFQPAVKIPFRCIEGTDTPEHLYKGMAQDIARLMFVDGIAHSDSHGKAIKLPVQLLLRFSIAVAAVKDNVDKILFQLPFFVVHPSGKDSRRDTAYIQFLRILQLVVEPDIPVDHIDDGDHAIVRA